MKKILNVTIPCRDNVTSTTLYVQIVYKNEGDLQNKPYIMMLPGGPGANHSYYKDYDCLQEEANIVYYDPRGCGLSDKGSPSTYTMSNYIEDVHYIVKEALLLEQVILLGKSYGAMCALGYALRYPTFVSKLILAAGSPSNENLETAKLNVLSKGTEAQQKICEILFDGSFQNNEHVIEYFQVMDTFYSWKKRHNEPVNRPQPIYPYAFEPLNEGFRTKFWNFNFVEQLHTIQCSTLILVGDEDWITDPKHSKLMAEKIPNSILKIFEKSDHSMESDVPEQFFNIIRQFVAQNISLQNNKTLFFNKKKNEHSINHLECEKNNLN
ncbi:MAG: alpha/beta fold hydrolase [Legionella longbeachae]|nr:alpha/beta fold hydrolase [Legionella longbeachae]